MKRTRMLPVLVALSVPASDGRPDARAARAHADADGESRQPGRMLQQACAPAAVLDCAGHAAAHHRWLRARQGDVRPQRLDGDRRRHQARPAAGAGVLRAAGRARSVHPDDGGLRAHQPSHCRLGRIVDATDDMAIATVTHACDGMLAGDYLEPFAEPRSPAGGRARRTTGLRAPRAARAWPTNGGRAAIPAC